eukprot:scaffold23265_cov59-Phaeocystis_antarctica.AAC.3
MDLQLIMHQVRREQARRLVAYSVSLTTAAYNATLPASLPASSPAPSPAPIPSGLPCSSFSSAGPWAFEHEKAHKVAKVPGKSLHRRSNSAIWHAKKPGVSTIKVALAAPAAPSAVYPSAMVAPAAYSQQAALQLVGVSPARAIAYGVPTSAPAITYCPYVVPAAPAIAYAVQAAPAIAMWSSTTFFGPPRATSSKRPAPAAPITVPPAKSMRPYSNPYTVFCQEQRPFLPEGLRNSVREQTLGQQWRELSKPERAKYQVGGSEPPAPTPAPEPAPASLPAPALAPASALQPPALIAPAPAPPPAPTPPPTMSMISNAPASTGLELLSTAALSMA